MSLRQQDYWDNHYEEELKNFQDDGDEGEIWFGKALTRKIINWLVERMTGNKDLSRRVDIIDIGCGNAHLLSTLAGVMDSASSNRSLPEVVNMLGLDYSRNSIELSRKILEAKNLDRKITLKQCDFTRPTELKAVNGVDIRFDFIIDKGTFDAICLLASNSDEDLRESRANYIESIKSIVKQGTVLIMASCNHTEDELVSLLQGHGNKDSVGVGCKFQVIDRIETPKILFGGTEGSQVCCLIIQFD